MLFLRVKSSYIDSKSLHTYKTDNFYVFLLGKRITLGNSNFKQVKCSISEKLISHVAANGMCDISLVPLRHTCPKHMPVYINSTNKGQEGPAQ